MRILHVLTEPSGGGGVYALALARASAAHGDRVAFASPEPLFPGFPTAPLPRRLPLGALRPLRGADLVHLHGLRAAVAAPLAVGRPVVVTTHGLHLLRQTGGSHGLVAAAARALLRRASIVICVSESERDDLLRIAPGLASRTRLVVNGVAAADLPAPAEREAARARLGLAQDAPVLLFAGGLRHQKHPELAVEAARIARERVPGLTLLVAGTGPLAPVLERAGDGWLRLLGQIDDVGELLAAADAVINTSRWEGLSLALLEALWRGRPLVVVDAPGNAEAAGNAGLVVPGRDAAEVAVAIERLFTEPGLLTSLSEQARARAESLFDERRMTAETLALYEELRP